MVDSECSYGLESFSKFLELDLQSKLWLARYCQRTPSQMRPGQSFKRPGNRWGQLAGCKLLG
jgi:hypothetical protein